MVGPRFKMHARVWTVLALALSGCSRPPAIAPPRPVSDPETVLATVRARDERIVTLRARFTADSRRGAEHHHTNGVLLVKKPDRFRLRMMLPLGVTVFDYVRAGDRVQVSLPPQDRVLNDPPADDAATFSQADLGVAFLRGAEAFPGACAADPASASSVAIACRAESGALLRRIVADASAATIRDETSYAADAPRLVIRYDDYRQVADMPLPFHILMQYPGRDLAVDIAIQRYEVNPALSDDLFQPVP